MRERILALINSRYATDDDIRALRPQAVPDVIALYNTAPDEDAQRLRREAIHMLGVIGGNEAAAFLVDLYRNAEGRDESLQVATATALGKTDHDAAMAVVLPLLGSGDRRLRKAAVVGLGTSRRPDVLHRVRLLAASDPDASIRDHARVAVEQIEARLR